jgi:Ca-activated chloride channel family protein
MLWLMLAVPVVIAAYLLVLRRKKKLALRYASLSMVQEAMGASRRFRRHVPPLIFLLALISMVAAIARPAAVVTLPYQYETVILAIDASGSMRAADVSPTRIAAAQAAARSFVADQPRSTRLAVVSFAATASVVQPPTLNREDVLAALDRIQLQRGTAIGSGILVSLKILFPDLEFDLRSSNPRPGGAREASRGNPIDAPAKGQPAISEPVPPGSYGSAAIIQASKMAAERGVRVFTVGIGTVNGEILGAEGWSMRVRLDEQALKTIANVTKAEYFYAGTATDLTKIYKSLNSRLVLEKKATEVTALFAAAGAVFALLSALLSLVWFNRIL